MPAGLSRRQFIVRGGSGLAAITMLGIPAAAQAAAVGGTDVARQATALAGAVAAVSAFGLDPSRSEEYGLALAQFSADSPQYAPTISTSLGALPAVGQADFADASPEQRVSALRRFLQDRLASKVGSDPHDAMLSVFGAIASVLAYFGQSSTIPDLILVEA